MSPASTESEPAGRVGVTPDTVFELASVTKQFTATAIVKPVEEGKVGLDDVRPAGAELVGVPVRELVHYEMVTASETRYYTFWLTPDGRVTNFISYAD